MVTIVIAVACFAVGAGLSYLLFKHGLKTRYDNIIKEAHTEAEVIKKNKLLEVRYALSSYLQTRYAGSRLDTVRLCLCYR